MQTNTRLSLYKLLLQSTIWEAISEEEYFRIIEWLLDRFGRSERRGAIPNLLDTFLWFPTIEDERIWVPVGHLNRLRDQVLLRVPRHASDNHPNVRLLERLQRHRDECNGSDILALRLSALNQRRR